MEENFINSLPQKSTKKSFITGGNKQKDCDLIHLNKWSVFKYEITAVLQIQQVVGGGLTKKANQNKLLVQPLLVQCDYRS